MILCTKIRVLFDLESVFRLTMQGTTVYYPGEACIPSTWMNQANNNNNIPQSNEKQPKEDDDQVWTIDRLFSQKGTVDFSTKKKKKFTKCPNLNSHHFRVFKNDIRRCYAAMVANVLNSSDFNLIRAFLVRYGVQNMNFLLANDPFGVYDPRYNHSFHCNLTGFDTIACYLGVLTNTSPDYSFQVHDTQIRIRSDSPGSLVIANYTVQGTHLYECSMELILKDLLQAFTEFNKMRKSGSFPQFTDGEEMETNHHNNPNNPVTTSEEPIPTEQPVVTTAPSHPDQEELNFVVLDALLEEDTGSVGGQSMSSTSTDGAEVEKPVVLPASSSVSAASLPFFEHSLSPSMTNNFPVEELLPDNTPNEMEPPMLDSPATKKRKILLEDEDLPFFNTAFSTSTHSFVTTNYLNESEMACFHAYVKRIEQLWAMRKSNDERFLAPARFPFTYTISGKLTIELDEEKRIQGISFNRGACVYAFTNYNNNSTTNNSTNNAPSCGVGSMAGNVHMGNASCS